MRSSRCSRVLVQQPTEAVSSADVRRGRVLERDQLAWRVWRDQAERLVRALAVVVVDVGTKCPLQLPFAEDQQPVQTLLTDRAHPTLGVRVCVGRPDRCLDHPDALGAKDLIEGRGELGVPVVDQEADRVVTVIQLVGRINPIVTLLARTRAAARRGGLVGADAPGSCAGARSARPVGLAG
jgi:hypothetical protein